MAKSGAFGNRMEKQRHNSPGCQTYPNEHRRGFAQQDRHVHQGKHAFVLPENEDDQSVGTTSR